MRLRLSVILFFVVVVMTVAVAAGQMIDNTQALNPLNAGINKSWSLGHDGRSISLTEVILRHGREAQAARDTFANINNQNQQSVNSGDASDLLHFLSTLVLFPPDDTASTLDAGNRSDPNFPQSGHGSIKLTVLFNNPSDKE
jgi:hypothetical protein